MAKERGSIVFVSNADHQSVRELYSCFPKFCLSRLSRLAPRANQRKVTSELLIYLGPDEFLPQVKQRFGPLVRDKK
jgi:hypothetical protein